jgi:hypothetical protein
LIPEEDLKQDLRRVADLVDGNPSKKQYNEEGRYWVRTFEYRFGGWVEAKEQILSRTNKTSENKISRVKVLADIMDAADKTIGVLSVGDYRKVGEYSPDTARRRFGSWSKAKKEAGVP